MIYFLTIMIYLVVALVLLLLVYVLRNVLRVKANKKRGPLASRFKRAFKFLEKEGSVTSEEYADYLDISQSKSLQDLKYLEELGFVEKVGKQGKHYYRFIGQGQ